VVAHEGEQRCTLEEVRGEVGEQVARHPMALVDDRDPFEVANALNLPAAGGAESGTRLLRGDRGLEPEDVRPQALSAGSGLLVQAADPVHETAQGRRRRDHTAAASLPIDQAEIGEAREGLSHDAARDPESLLQFLFGGERVPGHEDVVPDLLVSAKSLGAGMPIGAVTGRAEILDSSHLGGVGGTYGGSPVACAAAIEAVTIIRQPEFLGHARRLGEVMREVMHGWQGSFPIVGDVRGLGPMMLAEFVKDRTSKEPAAPEETLAIVRQAVASGVVVMRAGLFSNCVRLLPPLNTPEDMLREALAALGRAIEVTTLRPTTASA